MTLWILFTTLKQSWRFTLQVADGVSRKHAVIWVVAVLSLLVKHRCGHTRLKRHPLPLPWASLPGGPAERARLPRPLPPLPARLPVRPGGRRGGSDAPPSQALF